MKNIDIASLHELFRTSNGVCTDSRKIEKGSLFFALKGETFNGNDYACMALEQGAAYAVVDAQEIYQKETDKQDRLILVNDVLATLQQLAKYHRLQYRIPVIGLTGTNGKTTTKELITATLATKYRVISTEGNLNNHIGVPLTLLKMGDDTQVAVVEMGASAPGEINTLVNLVCPNFGLVTNVGKAHLLGFGSFEGVKKTKGELYDNLMEYKKIAFVNTDNPHLVEMVSQRPALHIVPYGLKSNCARILPNEEGDPFLKINMPNPCLTAVCENMHCSDIANSIAAENGVTKANCEPGEIEIKTNLIGSYNADNVLAALCISSYLNVPTLDAVAAIASYIPSNNRSQMTKTERNTLIIDAYNANPTSMQAALENFKTLKYNHKVLILGNMLELGNDSVKEHCNVIELAATLCPEHVYLVGEEFEKAYKQMQGDSCAQQDVLQNLHITLFPDSVALRDQLQKASPSGKTILIKGSRGTRLERVFDVL